MLVTGQTIDQSMMMASVYHSAAV